MLTKTWNSERARFDVLFDLPSELEIDHAAVVGDFNDWDKDADPMRPDAEGRWAATLSLEPGRAYRFRYHLGGDRWENDWSADDYADNEFGGADSVVQVPEPPSEPPSVRGTSPRSTAAAKKAPKKTVPKKTVPKKTAAKKKAAATKKAAGVKKATKKSTKAAKKATKKSAKRTTPGSAAD